MARDIASSILANQSRQQPKVPITAPPGAGPDSGVVVSNVPGYIKAEDIRRGVCVDLPAFIQRMQFAAYTGKASTAVGSNFNWAYALSDRVPLGRYWEVIYASVVCLGGSATAVQRPALYLISPSKSPAENSQAYQADQTGFFAGQSTQNNNGPPVSPVALRVDEMNDGVSQEVVFVNSESVLLRTRKLIVPPGWRLMAYGGAEGAGQGGNLGEQWQLKIVYSEFLSSEDTDVL